MGPNASAALPPGSRGNAAGDEEGIEVSFPNVPLSEVLLAYEDLKGVKVIRDANAAQATVSIETTGRMPKELAVVFIEKSLLLNGYSFVPAGDGMVKILAFDSKKPQIEGVPLIESERDLPTTDQVVNFVTTLKYLDGEEAIKAIDLVVPRHTYGLLTAVPNTKSLIITENSNTIRSILGVLEKLDNKPSATVQKSFQLTRSDVEDVKEALDQILEPDKKSSGGVSSSAPRPQTPTGAPGMPNTPAQPAAGISVSRPGGDSQSTAIAPKIIAIPRTNKLLVIAPPETIEYIGELIAELDGAAEIRNFVSRTLNYLSVDSAMEIIGDAISRSEGGEGAGSGSASGGTNAANTTNNANNNRSSNSLFGNNNSSFGSGLNSGFNSGFGNGLSGGMGIGGFSGGTSNLQPLRPVTSPRSMVVGKTLLISDPTANSIFASGPPEHLQALNEIIDELDRRPQQIFISVVIGQLSLDNNRDLGVETILRGALMRPNDSSAVAGGLGNTAAAILDPRLPASATLSALAAGTGLTFYGGIRDGLDVIVNTLQTRSNFQVLSRPTIFTMNNMQATISSGTSIPIATSTQGLTGVGVGNTGLISNVSYQPVVLSLNIVPLINSPDELTLQITQENSERNGETSINGSTYPILSQQNLTTTVMVKNQSTVLLGGLIREDKTKNKVGVPLLSKIPVINLLTGSRKDASSRRELLIFIQPRIVTGNGDLPPGVSDSPGTSTFGEEAQRMMNQEKSPPYVPPDERKKTRIGRMLQKLFE